MTPPGETTDDAVLGDRLRLRQPKRGHRAGHDAILLAAAVRARTGEHAVELGAGVGTAGLALAFRVPGLRVTLVEIDPALVALASDNAACNGLAGRVSAVAADVTSPARAWTAAGLPPGCAHHVLMNPPFNDPARQRRSPQPERARAHAGGLELLRGWCKSAARVLNAKGTLTLIWRADGLADVMQALTGFGAVAVLPVHPRAGADAIRIVVHAAKGSGAPLRLLPGLVLNDAEGRPTAAAESILRDAAPLPLA